MDLDERRVRRLGRRQGPRAQPRPPLRHRRLRGHPLLRDRARARPSSATASTSTGSRSRPSSTTCSCPTRAEELREATHELIRRNGLALLLHPPARLPRLRRDGALRAERAGRRDRSRSGPGAPTSARRASATASGPRSPRGGGSPRDGLIPHAKASGQYLNSILAKTEAANAGYDEAILLDERGLVCEGSGENIFVVRDGELVDPGHTRLDPRRHQPQVGDPDRRATSATPSSSATSPGPSSTWPTRSSSPAPPPSWCRCARSTTTSSASRARSRR